MNWTHFIVMFLGTITIVSGLNCYLCVGCDEVESTDIGPCEISENYTALCLTEDFGDDVIRSCSTTDMSRRELHGKLTGCNDEVHIDDKNTAKHCYCNTDNCNNARVDIGNKPIKNNGLGNHIMNTSLLRFKTILACLLSSLLFRLQNF